MSKLGKGRIIMDWNDSSKWKSIGIPSDFLNGNTEDGFVSLEVMDPKDFEILGDTQPLLGDPGAKKQKKPKRRAEPEFDDPSDPPGWVATDALGNFDVVSGQDGVAGGENDVGDGGAAGMGGGDSAAEGGELPKKKTHRGVRKKDMKKKKRAEAAAAAAVAGADGGSDSDDGLARERAAQATSAQGKPRVPPSLAESSPAATAKKAKREKQAAARQAKLEGKGEEGGTSGREEDVGAGQSDPLPEVHWENCGLHPDVERVLAKLNFIEPTPIQRECLPAAIEHKRDIIGAAETGSGKTLAFGLPILQALYLERLAGKEVVGLRALVVCPTRELAMQVSNMLAAVGKELEVRVVPIVGGISQQKQQRLLSKMPPVVVATPGRLWDLLSGGEEHLADLSRLSFFVLDEADRMVERGHFQEVSQLIDMLPKQGGTRKQGGGEGEGDDEIEEDDFHMDDIDNIDPEPREDGEGSGGGGVRLRSGGGRRFQCMVFSATLALPPEMKARLLGKKPEQLSKKSKKKKDDGEGDVMEQLMEKVGFGGKPKIADLTSRRVTASRLEEAAVFCMDMERDLYLYYLLVNHPGRTVVFCNAITGLLRVCALLQALGLPAFPLHSNQQQRQRLKFLDRFKGAPDGILVASDVAARGLDITGIRCVVHYQIPDSADVYVHRSGRTARAGEDGLSVAIVCPTERRRYQLLVRALGKGEEGLQEFPVQSALLPTVKKRMSLATRLDELMRKQNKQKSSEDWFSKQARDLDLVLDENDMRRIRGGGNKRQVKGDGRAEGGRVVAEEMARTRAQLDELLAQPVVGSTPHSHFAVMGGAQGMEFAQRLKAGRQAAAAKEEEAGGNNKGKKKRGAVITIRDGTEAWRVAKKAKGALDMNKVHGREQGMDALSALRESKKEKI